MTNIRAFIAVSLSEETIRGLSRTTEGLQSRLPGGPVRWVPLQNIHLTLKFLGDTPASAVDCLSKALESAVASVAPFDFRVGGLGAFPSVRRARVVWVGLQAPPALEELHRSVDEEMSRQGFPPEERPFSPHLTIGRVRREARPDDLQRLAAVLENAPVGDLGAVRVAAVHLYQSELRPSGPIYTRLYSAGLYRP